MNVRVPGNAGPLRTRMGKPVLLKSILERPGRGIRKKWGVLGEGSCVCLKELSQVPIALLMYMLETHAAEVDEAKRAVGFLGAVLTFPITTLTCLIYTLNRYY